MTNKEKALELLSQITLAENAYNNAVHWHFSQKEIKAIKADSEKLIGRLLELIPD